MSSRPQRSGAARVAATGAALPGGCWRQRSRPTCAGAAGGGTAKGKGKGKGSRPLGGRTGLPAIRALARRAKMLLVTKGAAITAVLTTSATMTTTTTAAAANVERGTANSVTGGVMKTGARGRARGRRRRRRGVIVAREGSPVAPSLLISLLACSFSFCQLVLFSVLSSLCFPWLGGVCQRAHLFLPLPLSLSLCVFLVFFSVCVLLLLPSYGWMCPAGSGAPPLPGHPRSPTRKSVVPCQLLPPRRVTCRAT